MATKLERPVTREMADWARTTTKDARRPLMVTLNPAGFLTFRLKGTQREYDLDLETAYMVAVRRFADRQRADDAREKKLRKAGVA